MSFIANGTQVEYHGSVQHAHGPAVIVSHHDPFKAIDETDTVRYALKYGPEEHHVLLNVRPTSFTVIPGFN